MIVSGLCLQAKRDFLMGVHESTDMYKVALYGAQANLSPSTVVYTPVGEVAGGGYQPGGKALSGYVCLMDGTTAVMGWKDPVTWDGATITAQGALIYNASKGNRALAAVDFGGPVSSTNGPWRLHMPQVSAATALIRIL